MKICSNCGKENNDEGRFCNFCGTELQESLEVKVEIEKEENIDSQKLDEIMKNINKLEDKNPNNKKIKRMIIGAILVILAIVIFSIIKSINSVNFKKVYNKVIENNSKVYSYITLGNDNSYMQIDTNPNDRDDYFSSDAWQLVKSVNSELELPEILLTKMGETRSIDGRRTESYGKITVSWTYHPDKGLEILYEMK